MTQPPSRRDAPPPEPDRPQPPETPTVGNEGEEPQPPKTPTTETPAPETPAPGTASADGKRAAAVAGNNLGVVSTGDNALIIHYPPVPPPSPRPPWATLPPAVKRTMLTTVSIVGAVALAATSGYFLENGGNGRPHTHSTLTPSPSPDVTLSTTFPANLDNQATDPTPQTATALLPKAFNAFSDTLIRIDSFTRMSGTPASCPSTGGGGQSWRRWLRMGIQARAERMPSSRERVGVQLRRSAARVLLV